VARIQAQLAHESHYGCAVLGNLAAVDPVVDAQKAMRQVRVELVD